MVVKVELPAGKLGLTAVGSPPAVGAVRTDSPVVGQVAPHHTSTRRTWMARR